MSSETADPVPMQKAGHPGSSVSEITGTGLGLAVVKAYVELQRGDWSIDSQPEWGTNVTVKLPLE